MVTSLDESVGNITRALADNDLLQNSIIVFLSDNGAETIGPHRNLGSSWPLRGVSYFKTI